MLIAVSNPKEHNSVALQLAATNGHTQCVELLYPVSDPIVALEKLQYEYPNEPKKWRYLEEMVESEHVRNALNSEVGTTAAVKVQRKL